MGKYEVDVKKASLKCKSNDSFSDFLKNTWPFINDIVILLHVLSNGCERLPHHYSLNIVGNILQPANTTNLLI